MNQINGGIANIRRRQDRFRYLLFPYDFDLLLDMA